MSASLIWDKKRHFATLAESRGQFKHVNTDQGNAILTLILDNRWTPHLKCFKIPVSTDSHPLWHVKKFSWLGSWRPEAIFHISFYLSVQVPRWRKGSFCPETRRSQWVQGQRLRSIHSLDKSNHNGVELLTFGRRCLKNNWFALQMFSCQLKTLTYLLQKNMLCSASIHLAGNYQRLTERIIYCVLHASLSENL